MNDFTPTHGPIFYGTATVGAKGQIVIPAKAREEMNIQTGDALVVFGKAGGMLGICPMGGVKSMLEEMTKKLETIQSAIDQENEQKKG